MPRRSNSLRQPRACRRRRFSGAGGAARRPPQGTGRSRGVGRTIPRSGPGHRDTPRAARRGGRSTTPPGSCGQWPDAPRVSRSSPPSVVSSPARCWPRCRCWWPAARPTRRRPTRPRPRPPRTRPRAARDQLAALAAAAEDRHLVAQYTLSGGDGTNRTVSVTEADRRQLAGGHPRRRARRYGRHHRRADRRRRLPVRAAVGAAAGPGGLRTGRPPRATPVPADARPTGAAPVHRFPLEVLTDRRRRCRSRRPAAARRTRILLRGGVHLGLGRRAAGRRDLLLRPGRHPDRGPAAASAPSSWPVRPPRRRPRSRCPARWSPATRSGWPRHRPLPGRPTRPTPDRPAEERTRTADPGSARRGNSLRTDTTPHSMPIQARYGTLDSMPELHPLLADRWSPRAFDPTADRHRRRVGVPAGGGPLGALGRRQPTVAVRRRPAGRRDVQADPRQPGRRRPALGRPGVRADRRRCTSTGTAGTAARTPPRRTTSARPSPTSPSRP